jgi:D-arabinose 1-dehydrogenase-like Zn-dependent alcohol dehydrogenase
MGSRDELVEATKFLAEKEIVPIVSEVLSGLDEAEKGFRRMEEGAQFGKIVIKIEERHPKL